MSALLAASTREFGGEYGNQTTKHDVPDDNFGHDPVFCLSGDGRHVSEAQCCDGDSGIVEECVEVPFKAIGEMEGFFADCFVFIRKAKGSGHAPNKPKRHATATVAKYEPRQIEEPETPVFRANAELFYVGLVHCVAVEFMCSQIVVNFYSQISSESRVAQVVERGVIKSGKDQACSSEISARKKSTFHGRHAQIRILEISVKKAGFIKFSTLELSAFHCGLSKLSFSEKACVHLCFAQVRFREYSIFPSTIVQKGFREVCIIKQSAIEIDVFKLGIAQVCSSQIRYYLRILLAPLIPSLNALFQYFQMLRVSHAHAPLNDFRGVWEGVTRLSMARDV